MSELIKDAIKSRSWHIENLIESEADAQVITVAEAIAIVDRYTETPKPDSEWVSVEDGLPEYGDLVVGVRDLVGGFQADIHEWDKYWKLNQYVMWQLFALPQPPKDID